MQVGGHFLFFIMQIYYITARSNIQNVIKSQRIQYNYPENLHVSTIQY